MNTSGCGDAVTRLIADGMALLKAGRAADVLRLIAAAGPDRDDPRILALKAYACAVLGRIADALPAARQALAASPRDVWALDLVGNAFTLCHQPEPAYCAFKQAQAIAPDRPDVLLNLATAAGFLGHADEAERVYDRIVSELSGPGVVAQSGLGDAYLNRSLLRRQTAAANHVPGLRAALGQAEMPWQSRVQLHYALGKELEDLDEYAAAFASIAAGARLRRSHMRYHVSDDIAAMDLIAATHGEDWCAPARAAPSRGGPIFNT